MSLKSIIQNILKLGKVTRNTNDSEQFPTMQITYLSKVADAMVMVPYGLSVRSIPGDTLCAVFNVQGHEENRIAMPLATTNRKKNLKDSEVVLENEKTKAFFYLKENGDLEISIPGDVLENVTGDVVVNIGGEATVNVEGDTSLISGGDLTVEAESLSMDITGDCDIDCTGNVVIDGPQIDIGGPGGPAVARIGDSVSGGVIVSGSGRVNCAD